MGATTSEVVEPRSAARPRRRLAALGQRLGLIPEPAGDNLYHGFISYSHAADGKLAPALQRGLQRFAKPWYRMRALHVFRDEAALSANPHLWESVKEALDASQHYILLASPRAAASEWVSREASYWLEHKSLDTMLIGLTDGELAFRESALDPSEDALPPPLRDAFPEEPRYIDLRWAKDAHDLSISHPQFRDAVAELAAPLHGKPKEEISSEEVRQHRRTLRVARSAAGTLATLLAAAIFAALTAYSQYQSAQSRSLAAQATADLAVDPQHSLSVARQSMQINTSATSVQALRQALAHAPLRMVIDSGAGDSTHAAWNPRLNQIAVSGRGDTVQLWNPRTGKLDRVLRALPAATPALFTSNGPLLYSADGQWLAYVDGAGAVSVWNAGTGAPAPTRGVLAAVAAAKVGRSPGTTISWNPRQDLLLVSGTGLDRVFEFDPSTGATAALVNLPGGADLVSISPDGHKVAISSNGSGAIFELGTRTFVRLQQIPFGGFAGHEACWIPTGRSLVTWDPTEAQDLLLRTFDAASGRQVSAIRTPATINAVVCGGTAAQPWVATGDYGGAVVLRVLGGLDYGLAGHSQFITSAAASPSGAYLASASSDGTARVWDTSNGSFIQILPDGAPVNSIQFSPDSGLALTSDARGLVKVWDAGVGEPSVLFANPRPGHTYPLGFARGGSLVYGIRTTLSGSTLASANLVAWSSSSGRVLGGAALPTDITTAPAPCNGALRSVEFCQFTASPAMVTHLPTGHGSLGLALAVNANATRIAYAEPGIVKVVSPAGARVGEFAVSGRVTGLAFARASNTLVAMTNSALEVWSPGRSPVKIPQGSPPIDGTLSADGSTVATAQIGGVVGVWSTTSGRQLAAFRPSPALKPAFAPGGAPIPLRVALSPDGSSVAAGTTWQAVSLWRVTDRHLIAVREVSSPRDVQSAGFGGTGPWPIVGLAFTDDGSRLLAVDFPQPAAGDSEPPGTAAVIDAVTGAIVTTFRSPGPSGASVTPGAALSPDGTFLFGGLLGFSPTPPGGSQAVYAVGQANLALNLRNAGLPPLASPFDAPVPADPWSPDGVDLLAGSRGIYTCDACGSISQLEGAAARRTAWQQPLSVAHHTPPNGSPYR